jgi:3-hydroxyacyl-[acyl-carrier-protein] dehydratase
MRFIIDNDHPCLPGHFPGQPVVPGVVVLDRVLDAVEAEHGPLPAPMRLPQAKFVRPLLPGQAAEIRIEATIGSDGARRWKFRVLLADAGDAPDALLASGEIALPAAEAAV